MTSSCSRAALLVGALLLGRAQVGSAPALPAAKPGAAAYRNAAWGFSMAPPAFAASKGVPTVLVAQFFAPPKEEFSANVNVVVQETTFDAFQKLTESQLKQRPYELLSKKESQVGTHPACEYVYRATVERKAMKFVALAVDAGSRVYLLTGTALESGFDDVASQFRDAFASFRLDP